MTDLFRFGGNMYKVQGMAMIFLILLSSAGILGQDSVEDTFRILAAEEVLPADLLEDDLYTIDTRVRNDGFMNHFIIHSQYGALEAHGEVMLHTRLAEIRAIHELESFSKSAVFLDAVKSGVVKPFNAAVNAVSRPVDTVKGIPRGVARFFVVGKRRVELGYQSAKRFIDKQSAAKEKGPDTTENKNKELLNQAGKAAVSYLGANRAQRRWARRVGTDPYSSNPILRKKIARVAWYDAAGSLSNVFVPSYTVVDQLGDINSLVWQKDPLELRIYNEKILRRAVGDRKLIKAFIEESAYSPTQQTLLVHALHQMDGVDGLQDFLNHAMTAGNEMEAILFRQSLQMLAKYHQKERLRAIAVGDFPFGAITVDNRFIIAAAVDQVFGTDALEADLITYKDIAARHGAGGVGVVMVRGIVDERHKAAIARQGFTLREGVAVSAP